LLAALAKLSTLKQGTLGAETGHTQSQFTGLLR
jgi:hypothetical protein